MSNLSGTRTVFNTAIANAKAVAQFPLTLGMPWVAINTASAVGSIASIVAQSIASFSQPKVYFDGEFTGNGRQYEPVGIVDKGAFLASKSGGYAIGGYVGKGVTTDTGVSKTFEDYPGFADYRQKQDLTLEALAKAVTELTLWSPSISLVMLEHKQEQYNKLKNSGLK